MYMTDFEDWYGVDIAKEPEKSGLCSAWLGDTHEEIHILRSKAEAFKGAICWCPRAHKIPLVNITVKAGLRWEVGGGRGSAVRVTHGFLSKLGKAIRPWGRNLAC